VQAPYEAISKEEWEEVEGKMPKVIEWEGLREFEEEDMTEGGRELACVGDKCEI
jgi:ribonucleoside-diphosphate reductase alpha chain